MMQKKDSSNIRELKKVVEFYGSQVNLARELGITVQYVNSWCMGRTNMPLVYAMKIEKMTKAKFTVEKLMSQKDKSLLKKV